MLRQCYGGLGKVNWAYGVARTHRSISSLGGLGKTSSVGSECARKVSRFYSSHMRGQFLTATQSTGHYYSPVISTYNLHLELTLLSIIRCLTCLAPNLQSSTVLTHPQNPHQPPSQDSTPAQKPSATLSCITGQQFASPVASILWPKI